MRERNVLASLPASKLFRAATATVLVLLSVTPAAVADRGDKAALTQPVITLEGRQVQVGLRLENAFDPELVERIDSGLPTEIVYRMRLVRDHPRWFDNTLDERELQVVAMYNAVTREYLVNFKQDGKLTGSRVVRSIDELETAMTRFENLEVFTLDQSRRRLVVRARAILGSRNALGFIPTKVTTEWAESRKFRLP